MVTLNFKRGIFLIEIKISMQNYFAAFYNELQPQALTN